MSSLSGVGDEPCLVLTTFFTLIAKRFTISQLFLSLSLPADLISALHGPYSASEGNKALLMIEGALGDILKQTII